MVTGHLGGFLGNSKKKERRKEGSATRQVLRRGFRHFLDRMVGFMR